MDKFIWDISTDQSSLLARAELRGREDRIVKTANMSYEKDNFARTLFFMPASPETRFWVKRYKIYNFRERLKSFFLPSPASQEYKALRYLKQKNMLVPKPVAILARKSWGVLKESFILLVEVPEAIPLSQFIQQNYHGKMNNECYQAKSQVLNKLASLVRALHSVNFYHYNLQAHNILVQSQAEGDIKLYLADLYRSKRINWLTGLHKQRNLAQLCYSLNQIMPVTDMVRLLAFYRHLDIRPEILRPFVRDIFNVINRVQHRHWQNRTGRCLKKSTRFIIDRVSGYRIYHLRSFPVEQINKLVRSHNTLAQKEPARLFKSTPRQSISIQTLDNDERFYVKEYPYRGFALLKNLLRRHPARAEWLAINGFLVRGMQTLQPLALVEKRIRFSVVGGYLILKKILGAVPISQYVLMNFAPQGDRRSLLKTKKSYLKTLARVIGQLHQRDIFHPDLVADNIMVQPDQTGQWIFYFLNLERVRFKGSLSWKERIKNLIQLNVTLPSVLTRADRLRFLNHYLAGKYVSDPTERRNIIARILKLSVR